MKSSTFKTYKLTFQQHQNIFTRKKPFDTAGISKTEALNQLKVNVGMLPILPKKKQNRIRQRQLQALRSKENKVLAYYFYQKSLGFNQAKDETHKKKMSLGSSPPNELIQTSSHNKNSRSINHYSFIQMKNLISEKNKYLTHKTCESVPGKTDFFFLKMV